MNKIFYITECNMYIRHIPEESGMCKDCMCIDDVHNCFFRVNSKKITFAKMLLNKCGTKSGGIYKKTFL